MHETKHFHNPRLLVVSANGWSTAGQIASALMLAGFEVAVVCPIDSPVYQLRKFLARFPYRSWNSSASIEFAIAEWSPDILVLADDVATQALRSLYIEASRKHSDLNSRKLMELLEFSFGNLDSFVIAQSKSEILSLAASLGITCPKTTVFTDGFGLAAEETGTTFPVVVKTDDAWGGLGVRVVNDRSALHAAVAELLLPYNLPEKLKRVLGRKLRMRLLRWTFGQPRKMSLQQYVAGRPCTRAVVCWKGKVLAGITVEVLATLYEFGPATVVKVIHHPNVTAAAEKIVAKLGLSGFLGFDFILDAVNNSWFLEMNPRTTPICHICANNEDLAGSFFIQVTGMRPKATYHTVNRSAFTLFPFGTRRVMQMTPDLPSEKGAPNDEPEYVKLCRAQVDSKTRDWFWYSSPRAPNELR
jgi:D-alanine-D-alanine ligase-like ATP-grasp enzyme